MGDSAEDLTVGGRASLGAKLSYNATEFSVDGDVSEWPEADFQVKIEDELILVGTRSGNELTDLTRGHEDTNNTHHPYFADVYYVKSGTEVAEGSSGNVDGDVVTVRLRRDDAAAWTDDNPTLAAGEVGLELDTGKFKWGDGTTAWSDLAYIGGGGGGVGAAIVRKFPFAYDTPDLLTGHAVYTPTIGDVLLMAFVRVETLWNGLSPVCDVGAFNGIAHGWMGLDDSALPLGVFGGSSWPSASEFGLVPLDGPSQGAFTPQDFTRGIFTVAQPIKIVVSQDGTTQTPSAASLAASGPPTAPLTIETGVNDEFGFGPGNSELVYTIAAGTYSTVADIASAMEAAVNGSSDPLSDVLTVVDSSGSLLATASADGAGFNAYDFAPGSNDALSALGFPVFQPMTGGAGGDPGSSEGAASLYLVTATPAEA